MPLIKVTSLDHPELRPYSSMRKSDELIVCDSEKVVTKLFNSGLEIVSLLGHEKYFANHPELFGKYSCYQAPKEILETIVGHRLHQSVMAIAKRPDYKTTAELQGPICILNGVTSPENVGNIIRSLTAFNIRSLLIDSKSASPYIRRAIRVSMGNIFQINVAYTTNLKKSISNLQTQKYNVIATANCDNAININRVNFQTKTAFVIGSEGHGIDPEIQTSCCQTVFIPITDDVLHLNAANAATIFSYECARQLNLVK